MTIVDSNLYEGQYLQWMYSIAMPEAIKSTDSYLRLFRALNSREFTYSRGILMDKNRLDDGIKLRSRYVDYLSNDEYAHLDTPVPFNDIPCSVLEVMVALAIRCEETIMHDPSKGNRVPYWFWEMVVNMGLDLMDDKSIDDRKVQNAIDIFLNRTYSRDGKGGLFYIPGIKEDLRNEELWTQLCWFVSGKE